MLRRLLLVSIALVALPAPARAVPKSAKAEYKAAVKLENEGKLSAALAAFEALPEAKQDFDVRLHIGSCLQKLGRLKDAKVVYLAITNDPTADQPTRDTATSELTDLTSRFPKLKISTTPETRGVVITVDGAPIVAPVTETVDPGERRVEATRSGKIVFVRKVIATEGVLIDVTVDAPLPSDAPRPAATVPTPTRAVDAHDGSSLPRTVGLIGLGVGAVGLGVGTVFLLRADGLRSESADLAAQGDPAAYDRTESARSAQLLARVSFGVGLAAAVTGAVLIVTSPRAGSSTTTTALRLGPSFVSFEGAW